MTTPAYKRIGDMIRQRINDGVYSLGSQLPTELELVDEFAASRMTVSKGLAELIDAGLIKRIRGKGTFVCRQGFEPIDSVKAEIPVIKCIFPGAIYEQSFASNALLQGVCAELRESRFQTGIVFCASDAEILAELERSEADNCAGCILWPNLSDEVCDAVRKMREREFPLVLLDSFFRDYSGAFVGTDNIAGADAAVEFLVANGHRRIAYISYCPDRSSLAERMAGFVASMARRGFAVDSEWLLTLPEAPVSPEKTAAFHGERLQEFLNRWKTCAASTRPTAFFTSHDFIAIELMKLAAANQLRIPDDISLIGFDNIDCSKWLPVPLTTMAHDFEGIGRLAGRLLIERLTHASAIAIQPRYYVAPHLMERGSVRSLKEMQDSNSVS